MQCYLYTPSDDTWEPVEHLLRSNVLQYFKLKKSKPPTQFEADFDGYFFPTTSSFVTITVQILLQLSHPAYLNLQWRTTPKVPRSLDVVYSSTIVDGNLEPLSRHSGLSNNMKPLKLIFQVQQPRPACSLISFPPTHSHSKINTRKSGFIPVYQQF